MYIIEVSDSTAIMLGGNLLMSLEGLLIDLSKQILILILILFSIFLIFSLTQLQDFFGSLFGRRIEQEIEKNVSLFASVYEDSSKRNYTLEICWVFDINNKSSANLKPEKIVAETFIDQSGLVKKLNQHIWDDAYKSEMVEVKEIYKKGRGWVRVKEYILESDMGVIDPNYPIWVKINGTAIFSTFRKIPKVNIEIRIPVIKVRINFSARKQIPKEVWTDI